jgi:hypothetical protein
MNIDYSVLTPIQAKVENIKSKINQFLEICLGNDEDKNRIKCDIKTIEYRIRVKLAEILREHRTMPNGVTLKLTADEIHSIYTAYLSLISYINMSVSYTPNKIEFLAFAEISVSAFSNLLDNGNDDVRQECSDIDNDLLNFTLSAAEQGQTKEAGSKIRLKARNGIGHALVQIGDTESVIDKAKDALNEGQFRYELKQIQELKALIDKGGNQ